MSSSSSSCREVPADGVPYAVAPAAVPAIAAVADDVGDIGRSMEAAAADGVAYCVVPGACSCRCAGPPRMRPLPLPLPSLGGFPSMRACLQPSSRFSAVITTFDACILTSYFSPFAFSLCTPFIETVPSCVFTCVTRPSIFLNEPRTTLTLSPTHTRTARRPYLARSSAERWPPTLPPRACRGASEPYCLLRILEGLTIPLHHHRGEVCQPRPLFGRLGGDRPLYVRALHLALGRRQDRRVVLE